MARPRKPTHLHVISGTAVAHPERMRERANEPIDDRELGDPPKKWPAARKKCWAEIAELAPWLRRADRLAVEVAAELMCYVRDQGVGRVPSPILNRLETMLGRLGLTPADRSKVNDGGKKGGGGRFNRTGKPPAEA